MTVYQELTDNAKEWCELIILNKNADSPSTIKKRYPICKTTIKSEETAYENK